MVLNILKRLTTRLPRWFLIVVSLCISVQSLGQGIQNPTTTFQTIFWPGLAPSSPRLFLEYDNKVYFVADRPGNLPDVGTGNMWEYDGSGNIRIVGGNYASIGSAIANHWTVRDMVVAEVPVGWGTGGSNIFMVATCSEDFYNFGGICNPDNDQYHSFRIWMLDSPAAPAFLPVSSKAWEIISQRRLTSVNDQLYFIDYDPLIMPELAKIDIPTGTEITIHGMDDPDALMVEDLWNEGLFFNSYDSGNGFEPHYHDGSNSASSLHLNINTPNNGMNVLDGPTEAFTWVNIVVFNGNNGINGREVWLMGPGGNLFPQPQINPIGHANPAEFTPYNFRLYFRANDGTTGDELWSMDFYPSWAISQVDDINPLGSLGSFPHELTVSNGELFFAASNGLGDSLYSHDGVGVPVQLHSHPGFTSIGNIVDAGDRVYYSLQSTWPSPGPLTLWTHDGNPGNAQQVPGVDLGTDPDAVELFYSHALGRLFFQGNNGSSGYELFVID